VYDFEKKSVIVTLNSSLFALVFQPVIHASGCRKHIGTFWHVTT